ncbi:hypothetical protein CVT25_001247 [Psilocybe cyanescens]|uniref:TRIP4/RQT4 C2HC5-type zinc finger domain-containing protein n=1 Tax=Psilocybe cyanescens TaxID=93625 RepID=A0A409XAY3_PSICY|nr:hypothetical protein CVT25_001247 [Psilocybe cyanescens]
MHKTPWTKPTSSLPSDRIKPKPSPTSTPGTKSKGKGKGPQQQQQRDDEPPKSKAVRRLEHLLSGMRKDRIDERDSKGGCFCLVLDLLCFDVNTARTHDLSPYTPLCHSCGLILCVLNAPYHACPHCTRPLLSATSSSRLTTRESLIARIEAELDSTLAAEHAQREQALQQARVAAGAFPMLGGGAGGSPSPSPSPSPATRMSAASAPPSRQPQFPQQSQTHKVMSLTSKTGNSRRVVVSSYTTTPVASRPSSRNTNNANDLEDGIPPRVPAPAPPSPEPRASAERPWQNFVHGSATYKPPTRLDDEQGASGATSSSRRRRGNKGKDKSKAGDDGDGGAGS